MIEFQREQKGAVTFLSCLVDEQAMDETVSGMLQRNDPIPGLLSYSATQRDAKCLCSYNITATVPLKQYLSGQETRDALWDVLLDVLDVVSDAEEYLLRPSDFVFDDQYVFVSTDDGKPRLVCLPVPHEGLGTDLAGFLRKLASETVGGDQCPATEPDDGLTADYQALKDFLERMKRRSADEAEKSEEPPTLRQLEPPEPTEEERHETPETGLERAKRGLKRLLPFGGFHLPSLVREPDAAASKEPWVVHLRTGHAQPVDHSPFRLGKKKEYVDFVIAENPTVGRSHADILVRNGVCALIDNNSLNGTFLNGERLEPEVEYLLKNRDRFTLSDEEFRFELRRAGEETR